MAIRSFFGYDDVPMPAGEQVTASVSLLPLPFVFKPGSTVGSGGVTYLKEAGWLKCKGSVVGSSNGVIKSNYTNNVLPDFGITTAAQVITFGLRWICPIDVTIAASWPHPIAILSNTTPSYPSQLAGSAFPFGSIPGWVAGKEYYLEAQYDIVAQVIRRRIDGVPIADLAMNSGIPALVSAGTARFCMGVITSGTTDGRIEYSYWFKDMYVIEKTGDGTADSFLGPQQIVPISVTSLDQPTWAATGAADAVTALNAVITDAASLATPIVTSDVANNVGSLGLSVPSFFGQVNGVMIAATARRKDAALGALTTQVTSGSDNSAQVTTALTNTMAGGYKLYFAEKAPSGVRWTRAALQAAKLKLTVA